MINDDNDNDEMMMWGQLGQKRNVVQRWDLLFKCLISQLCLHSTCDDDDDDDDIFDANFDDDDDDDVFADKELFWKGGQTFLFLTVPVHLQTVKRKQTPEYRNFIKTKTG